MTELPNLPFVGYETSRTIPNIVVDGAANESTVQALSHWPGTRQPPGLGADLSAQMAYAYLDQGRPDPRATCVTNNHFDQDGLVSVHALVDPDRALRWRDLLIDVAAAGDFGTYRHRAAARASMTIAAYADPDLSPMAGELSGLPYDEQVRVLYEATIPLLVSMATEPERFRDLWADEDERLTASERAIAAGEVQIIERPEVDLAVVVIEPGGTAGGGHRFTSGHVEEIHPFAVNNATERFRLLICQGGRYRYIDRYETWVQYRSRPTMPRVDMAPLAAELGALDQCMWHADGPGAIMPQMWCDAESSLDLGQVTEVLVGHLQTAPPAWDPSAER